MQKIVLIDGNSLLNRAYYATPPLTTRDGTPTNAVYAFINMLFHVITEKKPTHILVAFDRKEPTFRHEMYTEYKAGRKPMPDDLAAQVPLMKETLAALGIKTYERAGIEADDILGTAAKKFPVPTLIYTGDKDSFQLVDQTTTVCFTKRGVNEIEEYTAENFTEKTTITPAQIIELKSLMGDASDNIPGVAGVGEKTAKDLLHAYGSLDGVYAHLDEIKGKLHDKLTESRDAAYLSHTLATIDTNADLPLTFDDLSYSIPFPAKAEEQFRKLQFYTFLKKEGWFVSEAPKNARQEQKVFQRTEISDEDGLIRALSGKKELFILTEPAFSFSDGETEYAVKVRESLLDDGVGEDDFFTAFAAFLQNEENRAYFYDAKTFMHRAEEFGVAVKCPFFDFSVLKYLADFSGKSESVKEVLTAYGAEEKFAASVLFSEYAALEEKCKAEGMERLYRDMELPLVSVLYEMEKAGITVDETEMDRLLVKFEEETFAVQKEIYEMTGEFNLNSPKQLGEILFDRLKIGKGKKTKTGYSTSKEVLDELFDAHPVVPLILRYRQKQKLLSTYLSGMKPLLDGKKRLHTSFNQTMTATGRLSSKEPNLQNIPVRDEDGKVLRKMFVSRFPGGKIASSDYSQIELRLLAAFSDCAGLKEAFLSGKDVHAATAAKVFGVRVEEVTSLQRRSAKAVNFGVIYGISEYGLSNNIKISVREAKEYIETYFRTYPEVKRYMDGNVQTARDVGYCQTFLGRRRYLPELKSSNYNIRQFGERAAMNMPLQGASADIIKIAMLKVYDRLQKEGRKSLLVLQVHDELIVDVAPGEEEAVSRILKEEMEGAVRLSVPLSVDIGIGENWNEV